MPEGDTIRRLADKIGERFRGERCVRCITRDPRLVGVDLSGATIVDVDANGKHLLIRFDNGKTLHSHLRMDGSWTVGPPAREPEWRRRIEMWMESGRLTGIDLPTLELIATDREQEVDRRARSARGLGAALIRTNAERGPQNTTGRRLTTADHWIYGRRGRPCPICGTTLDGWDERASPWRRTSVWCPSCQRVDERRRVDTARISKLMALHPARRQPSFPVR